MARRPIEGIERERLTPAAYVALLGEREPQAAIARLNRELAQLERPQRHPGLLLLRAWLDPPQYLAPYFQAERAAAAPAPAPSELLPLLRAWLNPSACIRPYFPTPREASPQQQQSIRRHIRQHRDFKTWLRSLEPEPRQFRTTNLGAYTYCNRNIAINPLVPDGVELYPLAQRTGLYAAATNLPAIFARLDRRINQLRSQQLSLPHPTNASGGSWDAL